MLLYNSLKIKLACCPLTDSWTSNQMSCQVLTLLFQNDILLHVPPIGPWTSTSTMCFDLQLPSCSCAALCRPTPPSGQHEWGQSVPQVSPDGRWHGPCSCEVIPVNQGPRCQVGDGGSGGDRQEPKSGGTGSTSLRKDSENQGWTTCTPGKGWTKLSN